jgi:TonB family protein
MREDDGKPFHLRAKIAPCDSGDSGGAAIEGSYEELWESPERWRIEIDAGNVQAIEAREDDQFYRQLRGADLMPVCVAEALGLLYDPVPAADEIYEADWTQDVAVVDGDPVVRVRRGPLNPDGTLPLNTYAFWFDPKTGSLRGYQSTAYGTPSMTEYGNYIAWQGKEVPGRVDLLENGKQVLEATVEKIEDLGSVSDSTFDIPGVQPERMRDTDAYEGAVSVPVRVIRQAGAANSPPGHGVVLLAVNVDRTGRVTGSTVLRSAGLLLDVAAQQAAMKWVFAPAILDGKPASTMVRIQIEF